MSELMFELGESKLLQQWQKWANLARLEAIRADKAEALCDTLLAALKAAPMLHYGEPGTSPVYSEYCMWFAEHAYGSWYKGQRQAAIKMVEREQGETA